MAATPPPISGEGAISSKRTILALDTSTEVQSLALQLPSGQLLTTQSRSGLQPAEWLHQYCEQTERPGAGFLDALAVGTGPGLFTALRTGIGFCQGLARSLNIPCLGVGSFQARALEALGLVASARCVLVACQVRSDAFCLAVWVRGQIEPLLPPSPWWPGQPLPELPGPCVLAPVGDGEEQLREWLGTGCELLPCPPVGDLAVAVLQRAGDLLSAGSAGDAAQIRAEYLPGAGWKTLAEQRAVN